jgi:hypothetical protein
MTTPQQIDDLSTKRKIAARDLERIGNIVAAIDVCGDSYAHLIGTFQEDMKRAHAHLLKCEGDLLDAMNDALKVWKK